MASLEFALRRIEKDFEITHDIDLISKASHVILPGGGRPFPGKSARFVCLVSCSCRAGNRRQPGSRITQKEHSVPSGKSSRTMLAMRNAISPSVAKVIVWPRSPAQACVITISRQPFSKAWAKCGVRSTVFPSPGISVTGALGRASTGARARFRIFR